MPSHEFGSGTEPDSQVGVSAPLSQTWVGAGAQRSRAGRGGWWSWTVVCLVPAAPGPGQPPPGWWSGSGGGPTPLFWWALERTPLACTPSTKVKLAHFSFFNECIYASKTVWCRGRQPVAHVSYRRARPFTLASGASELNVRTYCMSYLVIVLSYVASYPNYLWCIQGMG